MRDGTNPDGEGARPILGDRRDPEVIERLVPVIEKLVEPWFQPVVYGLDRIPLEPALFVGNHSGGYVTPDSYVLACKMFRRFGAAGLPYGLGHEIIFKIPILGDIQAYIGVVPASHDNGLAVLGRGHRLLVYPGGDIETMRPWRDRNRIRFDGRTGYIRLALRAGVPIVPVVATGGHSTLLIIDDMRWLARLLGVRRLFRLRVWPLFLAVPWGVALGPWMFFVPVPSRIFMEVMEPIRFERTGSEAALDREYVRACADRVESAMQDCLDRLAEERRASYARTSRFERPDRLDQARMIR
jgi:1-acyl-sn-glycerol-3-phosphate acyltransferase